MKKMGLVAMAAVMAIGFSSFGTIKPTTTFYYLDPSIPGAWKTVSGTACPTGPLNQCKINTVDGLQRIFYTQSTSNPVYRPSL